MQTYLGGPIWDKIPQNTCLRGEFCILTKMCLGVYLKTFFKHVYTCILEWAPWGTFQPLVSS